MYQILPSGYCRWPDPIMEAKMKERMKKLIHQQMLKVERIQFNDPQVQFFVCNPYVAKVLEQGDFVLAA